MYRGFVEIPSIFVDFVVVCENENNHMQNYITLYNKGFSGEEYVHLDKIQSMDFGIKKIIARRAAMELKENSVVNLGIGIPEYISTVAVEEGISNKFILTVEAGIVGGAPASGLDFGCSLNPQAIISSPEMFDFYQGGGLDQAFLGLAETNVQGDVNVSKFGCRIAGCGGFIEITQNAKEVIFCGGFTAGDLEITQDGEGIQIVREGKIKKFKNTIEQITFAAKNAVNDMKKVLYITERAVFRLVESGLELVEIAPGVDLERDVLGKMDFKPAISPALKHMDIRIFKNTVMNLKESFV
jgi:propionate CoA-transferase